MTWVLGICVKLKRGFCKKLAKCGEAFGSLHFAFKGALGLG